MTAASTTLDTAIDAPSNRFTAVSDRRPRRAIASTRDAVLPAAFGQSSAVKTDSDSSAVVWPRVSVPNTRRRRR